MCCQGHEDLETYELSIPSSDESDSGLETQENDSEASSVTDDDSCFHSNPNISKGVQIDEDTQTCLLEIVAPIHAQKLSILSIAEHTAATTHLRSKTGITNCYVIRSRDDDSFSIQTDGVSFETAWEFFDDIDVNKITSNDVSAVLRTYGVEAARATIIHECKVVFGAYGISINPRHLTLIADYMTNLGDYRGCNYSGIRSNPSSLLKLSFERTSQLIQEAVVNGNYDSMRSPASRITIGRQSLIGTGSIDIVYKM